MEEITKVNTANSKKNKITIFGIVNSTILIVFGLICLFPFLYEILVSFASKTDYYQSTFIVFPKHFNIESYKYILFQGRIGNALIVSIFVTIAGTFFSMLLTIIGAYFLSREDMWGSRIFFYFILITMFFGGGLIPFFITVRNLGLMNSLAGIIVPFGINTFNMIILRNFFSRVPDSILESCKIDGASQIVMLFRFVVPLSLAGIATISLFYAVERWNDWYWPMLFITDDSIFPLSLELRNILSAKQSSGLGSGSVDSTVTFSEGQNAATIVMAIMPILAVYPFVQKYFVQGVMLGSVKE